MHARTIYANLHATAIRMQRRRHLVVLVLVLPLLAAVPRLTHAQASRKPPSSAAASGQTGQDPARADLEKKKLDLEIEKLRLENANIEHDLATKRKLEQTKLDLEVEKLRIENANIERDLATKRKLEQTKLDLEVEKLRIENANAERTLTTTSGWVNLLYGNVPVILAIIVGVGGLVKYFRDHRAERERRDEERFEEVVNGLGSEEPQRRVSAAVLLPTFLQKKYERFYLQVFNLAAGNLRSVTESDTERAHPSPLSRALVSVFREAYPRARGTLHNEPETSRDMQMGQYLNAAAIHLDRAFLAGADLRDAWLMDTSFREANLRGTDLTGAVLERCDFSAAVLNEAILRNANLKDAKFGKANLENADLSAARADEADFSGATLTDLTMHGGTLGGATFSTADLSRAKFIGVKFAPAATNGKPANPEDAQKLEGAVFENVTGLTDGQKLRCEEKGARFHSGHSETAMTPTRAVTT